MADEGTPKYLVQRQPKVMADDRGQSVSSDTVETAGLELVSTMALNRILDSDDKQKRASIEKAANPAHDGVLAMDPENGTFEIIDDNELQKILDENQDLPPINRPSEVTLVPLRESDEAVADGLSLVSTQALRKVLGQPEEVAPEVTTELPGGGFDPDNSS